MYMWRLLNASVVVSHTKKNDRKSNFLILATDHAVADVLLRT